MGTDGGDDGARAVAYRRAHSADAHDLFLAVEGHARAGHLGQLGGNRLRIHNGMGGALDHRSSQDRLLLFPALWTQNGYAFAVLVLL